MKELINLRNENQRLRDENCILIQVALIMGHKKNKICNNV